MTSVRRPSLSHAAAASQVSNCDSLGALLGCTAERHRRAGAMSAHAPTGDRQQCRRRMIRRRTAEAGFKNRLGLPCLPRDRHYRLPRARRHARKRPGDGRAREPAHHQALRPHWRPDHARRGREDPDLAVPFPSGQCLDRRGASRGGHHRWVGRLTARDRLPANLISAPNSRTSVGISNSPPATPSRAETMPMPNPHHRRARRPNRPRWG
jgi:hypothetical protein